MVTSMSHPDAEAMHTVLDELVALFLYEHPNALPSKVTLLEFMTWSFRQTQKNEEARFLA